MTALETAAFLFGRMLASILDWKVCNRILELTWTWGWDDRFPVGRYNMQLRLVPQWEPSTDLLYLRPEGYGGMGRTGG